MWYGSVLVFLLLHSSITMESQIDRDFQTAVSTQSQMCTSPSFQKTFVQNINQTRRNYSSPHWKISTRHWESIQVHTAKYQPNTEKVHIQAHTKKHQPKTEKVFKSTSSYFAPILALKYCCWWGCSELHIHFYWKYFHKTCFQSAWDDQPRSSDFSFKSNWMFCKIKTAPRFSFLPSQRSGMLAVQLPQTLLHMLFHSPLPD